MNTNPKRQRFGPKQIIALLFIGIAVFSVILFLIIFIAQITTIGSLVEKSPSGLITVEKRPDKEKQILGSFNSFLSGDLGDTLVLDQKDLNHLLRNSSKLKEITSEFTVEITDSTVVMYTSMDVERLQGPVGWVTKLIGREGYINSKMELKPELNQGVLTLSPVNARMGNSDFPLAQFMKNQSFDLATMVDDPDQWNRKLKSIKEVKITGEKLMLVHSGF